MPDVGLKLDTVQELHITPQLLQATRILQMDTSELREYISRCAEENPVLERAETQAAQREYEALCRQFRWLGSTAEGGRRPEPSLLSGEAGTWDPALTSLASFLTDQLARLHLDERMLALCGYLADLLNEDGYLAQEDVDALYDMGLQPPIVHRALATLQSLEPAGVGARSVQECLLLQLQRRGRRDPVAEQIVTQCLTQLGEKRYRDIAALLHTTENAVRRAAGVIRQLEPRPGRCDVPQEEPVYIIPDVIVADPDGQWQAILNDSYLPRMTVSSYYAGLLERSGEAETRQYLRRKLQQAQWVLSCLEKRRATLQSCADVILQAQEGFFRGVTPHLAPMTMRDASALMHVHESTVGRCVHGKYLQCRQGMFPMRYFFSHPVGGCSGQALRLEIAALIRSEDPQKPLSDRTIQQLLEEKGLQAARRTVAKHREALGIPAACKRRTGK